MHSRIRATDAVAATARYADLFADRLRSKDR